MTGKFLEESYDSLEFSHPGLTETQTKLKPILFNAAHGLQ